MRYFFIECRPYFPTTRVFPKKVINLERKLEESWKSTRRISLPVSFHWLPSFLNSDVDNKKHNSTSAQETTVPKDIWSLGPLAPMPLTLRGRELASAKVTAVVTLVRQAVTHGRGSVAAHIHLVTTVYI